MRDGKKIAVPEGMLMAFNGVTETEPDSPSRPIHGLKAALRWLDGIVSEQNSDFHRAILQRERERYPDDTICQVAFEFGASFARQYISGLYLAPEVDRIDYYRKINGEYVLFGNPDVTPELPKFIECDTCRAKPGSPTLCRGCLHNREIIEAYQEQLKAGRK